LRKFGGEISNRIKDIIVSGKMEIVKEILAFLTDFEK
jgi:hypothetical protein